MVNKMQIFGVHFQPPGRSVLLDCYRGKVPAAGAGGRLVLKMTLRLIFQTYQAVREEGQAIRGTL